MAVEQRQDDEYQRFLQNMRELEERDCSKKRSNGFPCSKISCEKYNTSKCLHPEKAGFPAQRY